MADCSRVRGGIGPAVIAVSAALGCASASSLRTTWEQDEAEGVLPSHTRVTRTSTAGLVLSSDTFTLDPKAVATRLERELLSFGARRRALAAQPGTQWSEAAKAEWFAILVEVERALTQPLGTLPRTLLIQVRVVLEAEMERTTTKRGPAPKTLDRQLARAFVGVAQRLRARPKTQEREKRSEPLFAWPVSPIILTSGYGYRRDPIYRDGRLGFHAGIDLAGRTGDPIQAARAGEVLVAGWKGGYGRAVFIQHTRGLTTVYGHLSRVLVSPGTFVEKGQAIGLMGSTGRATGSHLHFEIRLGSTPMNPLEILNASEPLAPLAGRKGERERQYVHSVSGRTHPFFSPR